MAKAVALTIAAREVSESGAQQVEVERALAYFETNAARMADAHFRSLGVFVGSGAIEAGCKAVIAQRLQLSGMCWNATGASTIVGLRCEEASGRWKEIWARVNIETNVA